MEITKTFYAKDRSTWRGWLKSNHTKAKEIWLIYYKKESGKPRVSYQDALEEALCFGWIDGQAKGIDSKKYAQRFTPRMKKSSWSITNIAHYQRLLDAGLVSEAGKAAFESKHKIYNPKTESVLSRLREDFKKLADPEKAKLLSRFFKTGKGEYAEGDRFYGVTVPQTRKIVKKYADQISFSRLEYLLQIGLHEERLCALLILVDKYKQAKKEADQKKIFDFYLSHTKHINNWDLVDVTSPRIIGAYLIDKPKVILEKLACSNNLWERRIAIISTLAFIQKMDFKTTLKIAKLLISDKDDLIQKAVGWMLREVGKKSLETEEKFLKKNYQQMGRTTLRYAIEKFPEKKRRGYLEGKM